ncbi:MAG: hypothetical protein KIH06_06510 [Kiritimatiellae bacterium]|nr:hypothetical protein [Kiritimatiellia bacterium]
MESANVVGYSQKTFGRNFNYTCNMFAPVGGTAKLGDIEASDDFYDSKIEFLTPDGANDTVDHPQLGTVTKSYKFWWAEDAAAKVRGWYLEDDTTGAYPMNDAEVGFGSAFCVTRVDSEPDCFLTYAGQVLNDPNGITLSFGRNFNYVGNCTPVGIVLGDIDASDDFYDSKIEFLTPDGANDKVNHPQLGTVTKSYKFWWAEDAAAKVRGWYLEDDTTGAYPMNDVPVGAGEAFCVTRVDSEPNCTITIPSAL